MDQQNLAQTSSAMRMQFQTRSRKHNMSVDQSVNAPKQKRKLGSSCMVIRQNCNEERCNKNLSLSYDSSATHLTSRLKRKHQIMSKCLRERKSVRRRVDLFCYRHCPQVRNQEHCALAQIETFMVDPIEDLCVHIFQFFVSDKGFVDADSMRSVMNVSKRWYRVANSQKIWGPISFSSNLVLNEDKADTKNKRMIHRSMKFRSRDVPSIKLYSFYPPDILSSDANKKYSDIDCSLDFMDSNILGNKLVGFANHGVLSLGSKNICFRAKERSTKKVYALKMPKDSTGKGAASRYKSAQPICSIRELAMLHKLSGTTHEGLRHICLVKAIDTFHGGHLLRYYDYSSFTLNDFTRPQATILNSQNDSVGGNKRIPITFAKKILGQLLLGLDCLHKQGIVHRNLTPHHILVHNVTTISKAKNELDFSRAWVEITDFSKVCLNSYDSELGHPVISRAGNCWYRSPEVLMKDERYGSCADIWSVGCIFAEIMREGIPLFAGCSEVEQLLLIFSVLGSPSSETWEKYKALSKFHQGALASQEKGDLKLSVPTLSDEGIDLLKRLLEPNPSNRVKASSALEYVFLQNEISSVEALNCVAKEQNHPQSSDSFSSLHQRVSHLKSFESFSSNLVPGRSHAQNDQWATIVDWVIEIVDVFDKNTRTAFLAMNYFDHFISNIKRVKTRKYQLIAATCLHVASKCEDAVPISVADLVFCADNTFSEREVIELEMIILDQIEWKLSCPLICDFVHLYVELTPEVKNSRTTFWFAKYLCELAFQSSVYRRFQASKIAACAVSFALHCVGQPTAWPRSLERASGFKWSDLGECVVALSQSIENMRRSLPRLKMITRRYRKKERACVAEIQIASIRSQSDINGTN